MATRLYLSENTAAPVSVTPNAGWGSTVSAGFKAMFPTTDGTDTLTTMATLSSTVGQDRLHRQFVSPRLAAGTSFASCTHSLQAQALESALNDNCVCRMGVRVVSEDGGTVRCILLVVGNHGSTLEWSTVVMNRTFANAVSGTNIYTTVAGDRLVVEVGHNDLAGASVAGATRWGSGGSSDLGVNDTSTSVTERPWYEISLNLVWYQEKAQPSVGTFFPQGLVPTITIPVLAVVGGPVIPQGTGARQR